MPAFLLPQIVLCGLFAARDEMSQVLDVAAGALPMTYAFDALNHVSSSSSWTGELFVDIAGGGRLHRRRPRPRRRDAPASHRLTAARGTGTTPSPRGGRVPQPMRTIGGSS